MAKYPNLPSINVELLDGNLAIDEPISGPVVLVVGTAYSGPTGSQYLAADSNVASSIYGSQSPLIKKMAEAKMTGAKNVVLYRVGGASAEIINLIGEDSLIGTKEQTVISGTKYSMYLGPTPGNPAISGLIIFEGDKIVYSDMPGSEVDLGVMNIVGDTSTFTADTGLTIGTPLAPVLLKDVMALVASETENLTITDTPNTAYALNVASDTVSAVDINGGTPLVLATDYTLTGTPSVDLGIQLIGSAAASLVIGDSINVTAADNLSVDTSEVVTVTASGVGETIYTLSANTSSITSLTVGGVTKVESTDYTVSGTPGSLVVTFISAQAVGAALVVTAVPVNIAGFNPDPYYSAGADNVVSSNMRKYELIADAYLDLETTIATHMVVDGVDLDTPNIADGVVTGDYLKYLRTEEVEGIIQYIWGTDKIVYVDIAGTGETNDPLLADVDDNGQPVVKYLYNEVNFGHQMGSWLNSITENDRFILGVIGTSGPVANTTSSIAKWVGTLPVTDPFGAITTNGDGLLGNRFMSGSTTQTSGFYATDSGYPDGNTLFDSNGAAVDLGKFMSVMMGIGSVAENSSRGTSQGTPNAAGLYVGLLSTINPGQSTTNRVLPFAGTPFSLKKSKLDELSYAGYVSLTSKARGTVVVSGELPTGAGSDYDYVSTSIIIGGVVREIRDRLDPFIGNGLNQITIAAANTAVEAILQEYVTAGAVVKYAFQVLTEPGAKGQGVMRVPLTIVPAFELREISVSIKLAYDI
ncbi:hypothetical protein N9242_00905 [Vicingaceae bacterium]|nr:hypothetical protein [Vicingaceae bacterium]